MSSSNCSSPREGQENSSQGDSTGSSTDMSSSARREDVGVKECHEEKDPKNREVRKLLRVMANRRSARESRDRRKKLVADLQIAVSNLADENAKIVESNLAMRRELVSLLQEAGLSASLPL
jgi:CRISPR/Cas system CSM-associated protein Csm2 small subunit